jgi:hypothetical protein
MKSPIPGGRFGLLFSLSFGALLVPHGSLMAQFAPTPSASTTITVDRDQMAWQLGVTFPTLVPKLEDPNRTTSLNARPSNAASPEGNWTDDKGNTITRSGWGLWNNYDDVPEGFTPGPQFWRTGVGVYAPVDDLKMKDGTPVTTQEQWWTQRRPEIFKAVQEELYGKIPDASYWPDITWSLGTPTTGTANGVAYRQVAVTGTISTTTGGSNFVPYTPRNIPRLTFTVRVPQASFTAGKKVGMIVTFGGTGPWQYVASYTPGQPNNPDGTKGNGIGIAGFTNSQLQPDSGGQAMSSYIIGLINRGEWRKPDDWGALAAWSWGISRFIDYVEGPGGDLLGVDAKRIGVQGHSRYGKAALVAAAYDTRILAAYPSSAGSLGTAPYRRHYGQDLANSSWDQEYHWMAGNFLKWGGPMVDDGTGTGRIAPDGSGPGTYLPRRVALMSVEAHSVAALVAPRALMITGGNNGDAWQDPYGMFLTARDATPVWNLLGRKGLILPEGVTKPVVDTEYLSGHVTFRYHTGGHTDAADWPTFAKFAAKFFSDVIPPSIGLPLDQTVAPTSAAGATVTFDVLAVDEVDDQVPVKLSQASGSVFPIGTTLVTATATDVSSNTATESFTVTVEGITRGGFSLNRATRSVVQPVTLKNLSPETIAAPVCLVLDDLSSNTVLTNRSGITENGHPYLVLSSAPLAPGASVTAALQFANPDSGGVTYYPHIQGGANP